MKSSTEQDGVSDRPHLCDDVQHYVGTDAEESIDEEWEQDADELVTWTNTLNIQ